MNSINICLAENEEMLKRIYRLRGEVYTKELGSFSATDLPDGIETDIYDEYSVHIAACDGDKVIGTLRLVKDNPHGFVLEKAFVLPKEIRRETTVEHSRGIVLKGFRDQSVYSKMLHFAYDWQRNNGYDTCIGAPNIAKLSKILEKFGWEARGSMVEYHNIKVILMIYKIP